MSKLHKTIDKLYKHTGALVYRYNLADNNEKLLEFEIIDSSPLTFDSLKARVVEDYQSVLGMATVIGTLTYTTNVINMEVGDV